MSRSAVVTTQCDSRPTTILAAPGAPVCAHPIAQVRGEGYPDISAWIRPRTVEERESSVDATRQKRRILVVRLHDQPVPFERPEVGRQRQRNTRTFPAERRICHSVLPELVDEGNARIFDPPHFLRVPFWIGTQRRLCIDPPSVDAIVGSRRAQRRVTPPILDPAKEERGPVRKTRRSRVEHRMRRYGQSAAVRIGFPGCRWNNTS
jgi:hypothetical protein